MHKTLAINYKDQVAALVAAQPESAQARLEAMDVFARLGVPQNRDEDWRHASLKKLTMVPWQLMGNAGGTPKKVAGDFAAKIVFLDGIYSQTKSQINVKDVSVQPVAAKLNHMDGLSALNAALHQEAVSITVAPNVTLKHPILIQYVTSSPDDSVVHGCHYIEIGEGANASILEMYQGADTQYWLNDLVTIYVQEGATLRQARLVEAGQKAIQTSKNFIYIEKAATYKGFALLLGGDMVRNETHITSSGAESFGQYDTVALTASGQNHDTLTTMNHKIADSASSQMYRSVVAARGKASFQGKITVAKDAQRTNAEQSSRAILLDRAAEANAKPELEIFADDVKCSHGATVGELDDKALFYCMSRGLSEDGARMLLIEAFIAEMFERIEDDTARSILVDAAYGGLKGLSDGK